MREKVAIATVHGKAYFLLVNALRENNIQFVSLVPDEAVPPHVKLVVTTEQEKALVNHERVLVFHGEEELDRLISEVKRLLLGKEAYERIIIGLDPGEATGLAVVADGKVIEEGNCYSTQEVISTITKVIKDTNVPQTAVSVKIGNGVPVYRELLEDLDRALPQQVTLEVVGEAGTNKPLKKNGHSRGIRHISSAIRIAGRSGNTLSRRKSIATNSGVQ
jgi:transcriptional accessory protein Tex/SPT6